MQLEFFDVPSPCVSVCQSNTKGYCLGCMRTRAERKEWTQFDNNNKQRVIKLCIQRKRRQKSKELATPVDFVIREKPQEYSEQPSLLDSLNVDSANIDSPKKIPVLNDNDNDLDFGDFEL